MTKDVRDEFAEDTAEFCYCAGQTCSGCEENTIKLIKMGWDKAIETQEFDYYLLKAKAEKLVGALEQIKIEGCLDTITTTCYDALKDWRGE